MRKIDNESEVQSAVLPSKGVAGAVLTDRRSFLARGVTLAGAAVAGGLTSASAARAADSMAPAVMPWQLIPGQRVSRLRSTIKVRGTRETGCFPAFRRGRPGYRGIVYAATVARGHDYAERAALQASPQRRTRHRPRAASTADTRSGQTPAVLLSRRAVALSNGEPHLFIECGGNSFRNTLPEPAQVACG